MNEPHRPDPDDRPDMTSLMSWWLPALTTVLGIAAGWQLAENPTLGTVSLCTAIGAAVGATGYVWHRLTIRSLRREVELLRHRLSTSSYEDPDTHLTHRDYGLRRLMENFAIALRHGYPISFLLLRVDPADDETLNPITNRIRTMLRAGDVCSRYDETRLMIVAPATDRQDAVLMAYRLLRTFAKREILGDASISMAVASWPSVTVKTAGELVSLAEEALQRAMKESGHVIAAHRGDQIDLHHAEAIFAEAPAA